MLFGTDGIRGKVSLGPCSDPIEALVNDRKITLTSCGWLDTYYP